MAQCKVLLKRIPDTTVKVRPGQRSIKLQRDFDLNANGSMVLQDITTMVLRTTECAIQEQEKLDNPPTHITVNGKAVNVINVGGPKNTLVYKTRTLFTPASSIREAAIEAYILLRAVTRFGKGFASKTDKFHIYLGKVGDDKPGKHLGKGSAGIQAIPKNLGPTQVVHIVGPLVPYGRRLYWNPKGRTSGKLKGTQKTRIKEIGGGQLLRKLTGVTLKIKGTLPMHVDVKRRMKRKSKFKGLTFTDPFVFVSPGRISEKRAGESKTMARPLRMPSIKIQVKRRGRIR